MTQPPPDQQPTQHAPRGPQGPPTPPPYGAGGYGAPYQPSQPYQQPYGQPYGQTPQPPSGGGSGKTIAIIVAVIVGLALLLCGGIVAFVWWIADNVEDSVDEWDADRVGGRNNPITVEEGAKFEIDGVEYSGDWRIQAPAEDYKGETIVGLTGTNDRADESSEHAYLSFTFVDADDVEVGEITCSSDGSIGYGNSESLDCSDYDPIDGPYDHIEVSAS